MGYGLTMEGWDPRLVHVLAGHHRVVMFDNAGIGRTRQLPVTASIDDMADQTSALIAALRLGRARCPTGTSATTPPGSGPARSPPGP
jgi:pimeloyl-ACP methyl ester carboxylesterase